MTVGMETPIEERGAARRRQRLQRLGVEHRALRRVRRLDQRRCAGDGDALLDGADLQREVEREELLRADADAAAVDRLVALKGRLDGVGAGIDVGEDVLAALVRDGRALDVRLLVGQRDLHARHDAPGILEGSAQTSLESLPGGRCEVHDAPATLRATSEARNLIVCPPN